MSRCAISSVSPDQIQYLLIKLQTWNMRFCLFAFFWIELFWRNHPNSFSFQAVESISMGSTLKAAAWFGTYRESTCRGFLGGIFGQTWTLNSSSSSSSSPSSSFFFVVFLLLFWFVVRIQERSLRIQPLSNPRFAEAVELNTSPSAVHLTIRRIHGHLESSQIISNLDTCRNTKPSCFRGWGLWRHRTTGESQRVQSGSHWKEWTRINEIINETWNIMKHHETSWNTGSDVLHMPFASLCTLHIALQFLFRQCTKFQKQRIVLSLSDPLYQGLITMWSQRSEVFVCALAQRWRKSWKFLNVCLMTLWVPPILPWKSLRDQ